MEAEHEDLPLFDGSALPWVSAFQTLPRQQIEARRIDFPPCRWDGEDRGLLEVLAASEFRLRVEWSKGPYGEEYWEGSMTDLSDLLPARTFIEAPVWWQARLQGLLHGVTPGSGRLLAGEDDLPHQALEELRREGVSPTGQVWTGGEERVPMECAAHKALDLVGDIACAMGYLPALRITARDAGHALHARLCQALRHAHEEKKETSHATPVRPAGPQHS